MHRKLIPGLWALFLTLTASPLFAHGGHGTELSTPTQHFYAHLGSGWMLLVSLVVLGKLVLLFSNHLRRSETGGE